MSDNFGKRRVGRVYEGGKFYSKPATDIPANTIYCPYPSASAQFGVAEFPVASGDLGSFSKAGTFSFAKPSGWASVDGQPVWYKPTTCATGTLLTAKSTGGICVGFECLTDQIPSDQIYVDINGGTSEGVAASA